jgi:hypothetical protein
VTFEEYTRHIDWSLTITRRRGDQVVAVDQSGSGRARRHSVRVTTQITGIR